MTYRSNRNTPETFWERVDQGPDCWTWRGYLNPQGYGSLQYQGRRMLAHRLSYELAVGPIPAGMLVCHSCDNPPCVRPAHLWLGTIADNLRDAGAKGRMHRGERHGMARLTADDVMSIRAGLAGGTKGTVLARKHGISRNTVYAIAAGRSWGWLS